MSVEEPKPIVIDGEIYKVSHEEILSDEEIVSISYCRGCLSPGEAEELRDWLTSFLEWYYQ
jgi:hypothetical protein